MNRVAAFAANAPLMSVPGASAPPSGVGEWYRGAGGLRLRAALWRPEGAPRGTVVLSPGRTEPIEKYYEAIADFLARDFAVLAHDWRGQGLSARLLPDRLKGHGRAVEEYIDDFSRLLDTYEAAAPKPWIMVGHSMGGVLNLLSLESGESRFAGAVLSSPMLRLKTGKRSLWSVRFAARWNVRHGKAGDYVLDEYDDPFEHTFGKDSLTHDEHRYERWREQLYACPHLAVGGITWGWLHFAVDAGERALKPKALRRVRIPLTIVQAANDDRVWKTTAKWAAKRIPNGRYVEVPRAKHEVLMELDDMREQFFREFDDMADRVAPRPGHMHAASESDAPSPEPMQALEPETYLEPEPQAAAWNAAPAPMVETPQADLVEPAQASWPPHEPIAAEAMDVAPTVAEAALEAPQAESRPEIEPMAPTTPLQAITFGPLSAPPPNASVDEDEPPLSLNR
ncbi:MAG: alpha/beta fold hydrolase [Proteobacteria bacterium]|nr:alpha/beta fold hydrolase [Pseudomonadota bacterium]